MADESLSLDATAARYGIVIPRFGAKAALQSSFLTKPLDAPLTQAEAEYCAADAQLTAAIRGPQRVACDQAGICEILDGVVMPWNVTAAEIEWTGVLFDRDKCRTFLDASTVRSGANCHRVAGSWNHESGQHASTVHLAQGQ